MIGTTDEVQRIKHDVLSEASLTLGSGLGPDFYRVACVDPQSTLAKIRETLEIVLTGDESRATLTDDESIDNDLVYWRDRLPRWFLKTFEDTTRQLILQANSADADLKEDITWSFESWISSFDSYERSWWWWSGRVLDDASIEIAIAVDGWPYEKSNLLYLIRVSGGGAMVVT